jgi:CheY-like chemotaxis protein
MEGDAPHVALVDFNMPTRDGLHLAADLRSLNPKMPIGIISANHQQDVLDRTSALGATFLPKPLAEKTLREFLSQAVHDLQGSAS